MVSWVSWLKLARYLYGPLQKFIKGQWWGLLVGLSVSGAVWLFYFEPTLSKYRDLGNFAGSYEVRMGETLTISQSELSIRFEDEVLRRARRKDADSVFVFPSFSFLRKPWSRDSERYDRFAVGHRLSIDGQHFYYTVELMEHDVTSKDTVAYFDVFRKEYSERNKGNP